MAGVAAVVMDGLRNLWFRGSLSMDKGRVVCYDIRKRRKKQLLKQKTEKVFQNCLRRELSLQGDFPVKQGSERSFMAKSEHPFFEKFKAAFRLFKKEPSIVDLSGKQEGARLFIANHSAANGPLTYELYFPYRFTPWGAHEMCGGYRERWHYLYDVFYQQKLHYSKAVSFLIATPFALISRLLYSGAELIPTYRDMRMKNTFSKSIEILKREKNILIFPENSSDGYHDVLKEYHAGFVKLAKFFYKRAGRDVPICTVYFSGRENRMVIDKPVYLHELIAKYGFKTDFEIAEYFKNRTNQLKLEYMPN